MGVLAITTSTPSTNNQKAGTKLLFQESIYQLLNKAPITEKLTRYNGRPAIFYSEVPGKNEPEWEDSCYPRICYSWEMKSIPLLKSAGTLVVRLQYQNTEKQLPGQIKPLIRKCLEEILIQAEDDSPCCFIQRDAHLMSCYKSSGSLALTEDTEMGTEICFDILKYPCQETSDPDPVTALNQYIKNLYPDALILGIDPIKTIKLQNTSQPVYYCHLDSIKKGPETNTAAWINAKISVFVLCPSEHTRLKRIKNLAHSLSLDGEIIMTDGSPMSIKRYWVNNIAAYQSNGQILISAHYGLCRSIAKAAPLNKINIKF